MATWMRNLSIRALFARMFTLLFFVLAFTLVSATAMDVVAQIQAGKDLMQTMIKGVNGSIIALAVYELAMVIRSEYSGQSESHDVITMLRRTLPRFIGTVCVAMSLEGLIMIIKYSQLDLAGNLYYPVAIIVGTAMLLAALGVFLRMAPKELVRINDTSRHSDPSVQSTTDPTMVKPGEPLTNEWQTNEPSQGLKQVHA